MNSSKRYPSTRFEAWLERRNISWGIVITVLSVMIFLGEFPYSLKLGNDGVYKNAGYAALIVAYALICLVIGRQLLNKVFLSLQELITDFDLTEKDNLGFEWQSVLLTCLLLTSVFLMTSPETAKSRGDFTFWFFAGGTALANLAFGWIIFSIMAGVKQITTLVSRVSVKNVFDTMSFRPVANWCLSMAISIMGAVTIATLFLKDDMLMDINLFTYAIALFVGIFVFFAGMWSTHELMQKTQKEAIKKIDSQLSRLHNRILEMTEADEFDDAQSLLSTSASLAAQKKLVEGVPVWPYTLGNLGGLFTSISVPVLINIVLRLFN